MNTTRIEWLQALGADTGRTWNPVVGCSRGCGFCYARRQARRKLRSCAACGEFRPHLHPERLDGPKHARKPRCVFVCSMGDLWDPKLSFEDFALVMQAMAAAPWHFYFLLTKRGDRVPSTVSSLRYLADNGVRYALGHTVTGAWPATEAANLRSLLVAAEHVRLSRPNLPAPPVFASVEPMLGPVDGLLWHGEVPLGTAVSWVLVGPRTDGARVPEGTLPRIEHVSALYDRCRQAGAAFFAKDKMADPRRNWYPHLGPSGSAGHVLPPAQLCDVREWPPWLTEWAEGARSWRR